MKPIDKERLKYLNAKLKRRKMRGFRNSVNFFKYTFVYNLFIYYMYPYMLKLVPDDPTRVLTITLLFCSGVLLFSFLMQKPTDTFFSILKKKTLKTK